MKNQKIIVAIAVVLTLLSAALVGYLIYELIQKPDDPASLIVRAGVAIGSFMLAAVRLFSSAGSASKKLYAKYEADYKEHLQDAFTRKDQEKDRRQLLESLHLFNRNSTAKGIILLEKLLPKCQKPSDYAAVYFFLGVFCEDVGNLRSAADAYRNSLKYDEKQSSAWSNLGSLCRRDGKFADAADCFKKAIECAPDNAFAYNNLGNVYFATGEYRAAIDCGHKALECNGRLYQAADLLCLCYAAIGDDAQYKRYFDIAISNGSDSKKLSEVLQTIKEGRLAKVPMNPIPDEVRQACEAFYRETVRPFARMGIPRNPTGSEHSRLGGAPLGEIPLDPAGKPMRLLCAIDCSEVKGLPDFPENGWLCFYIADNDLYGADFDHPTVQTGFRVIYTEQSELAPGESPRESETFPVYGCYPMAFVLDTCAMNNCDYRFEDTMNKHLAEAGAPSLDELPDEVAEELYEQFFSQGHRLLGTPLFAQEDPREDEAYRKFDTLLLQVDSHYDDTDTKVMIGDSGAMQFFIPRENLKKRDFSEILYWWDCH